MVDGRRLDYVLVEATIDNGLQVCVHSDHVVASTRTRQKPLHHHHETETKTKTRHWSNEEHVQSECAGAGARLSTVVDR